MLKVQNMTNLTKKSEEIKGAVVDTYVVYCAC